MANSPRDELKKLQQEAVSAGKLPSIEVQHFIADLYDRMEGSTTDDNVAWARDRIAALASPLGAQSPDSELIVLPAEHLSQTCRTDPPPWVASLANRASI